MSTLQNKRKRFRVSDLTEFRDIIDRDGYMDCEYNFAKVLKRIIDRQYDPRKCVLVRISCVGYRGDHPYRYSLYKKYRCRTLFRKWFEIYSKPFTQEVYDRIEQQKNWEFDAMEKAGERRAAWGLYAHICMQKNAQTSTNLIFIG